MLFFTSCALPGSRGTDHRKADIEKKDSIKNKWSVIIFNKSKISVLSSVDFLTDYNKIISSFMISNSAKSINSMWFGKYYFANNLSKGENNMGAQIIDFEVTIRHDSSFFSGNGFQTYFFDFCNVLDNRDTLELFYSKTLEGTDNNSDYSPVVKLYKKSNKYFIKSPTIWIDAVPNVEVEVKKTK